MQHKMRPFAAGFAMACLAAGGVGIGIQGPASQAAAAETIGVVDFVKVFEAYPNAISERKRLEELDKKLMEGLKAEEAKLQDMRLEREKFKPGTKERSLVELDLNLAVRRLEGLQEVLRSDLTREYDKFIVRTYEEIEVALGQAAKTKGISVVLRLHREASDVDSIEIKSRLYDKRMVWYSTEEVDLTTAVIKLLQVQ